MTKKDRKITKDKHQYEEHNKENQKLSNTNSTKNRSDLRCSVRVCVGITGNVNFSGETLRQSLEIQLSTQLLLILSYCSLELSLYKYRTRQVKKAKT